MAWWRDEYRVPCSQNCSNIALLLILEFLLSCLYVITPAVYLPALCRAFSRICLFVRDLKGKQLELSVPKLVDSPWQDLGMH